MLTPYRGQVEGRSRAERQGGSGGVEEAVRARAGGQAGPAAADPRAGTLRAGQREAVRADGQELVVVAVEHGAVPFGGNGDVTTAQGVEYGGQPVAGAFGPGGGA